MSARRTFAVISPGISQLSNSSSIISRFKCDLEPEFWQDEPDIFDPRLCAWLESKNFHTRPDRAPVPMVLIPSGKNSFKLHPVRMADEAKIRDIQRPPAA